MEALAFEVVPLREDQVEEAGALIARAFHDEPLFMYVLPDPDERARVLPWYFARGLQYMCRFSEPPLATAPLVAVALWIPPTWVELADEQLAAVGWDHQAEMFGAVAYERLTAVHLPLREAVAEPFWYLDVFAVEPAQQGAGVGSRLLQAMLTRTDAAGLPTALTTLRSRNVPFYQRHGYAVLHEDTDPASGLAYRFMRRDPPASG